MMKVNAKVEAYLEKKFHQLKLKEIPTGIILEDHTDLDYSDDKQPYIFNL
jgi:hypothetical protein